MIPNLCTLAQRYHPDILFLSETLANSRKFESIRVILKFDACLLVDVEGRNGGIALSGNKSSKCSILNFYKNFINILVQDVVKGDWRLKCYYGYLERDRRREAWDLICELNLISTFSLCIIGDFNNLLSQNEK